jgi:hypothetical protein
MAALHRSAFRGSCLSLHFMIVARSDAGHAIHLRLFRLLVLRFTLYALRFTFMTPPAPASASASATPPTSGASLSPSDGMDLTRWHRERPAFKRRTQNVERRTAAPSRYIAACDDQHKVSSPQCLSRRLRKAAKPRRLTRASPKRCAFAALWERCAILPERYHS